MYVLLPLLYYVTGKVRADKLAAAGMIALGFIAWFVEHRLDRVTGWPAVLEYAPWFCMGSAAYAIARGVRPSLPGRGYVVWLLLFIASPCIADRAIGGYRAGWVPWVTGTLFAVILPYFREITNPVFKRAAHVVAKYSYGIYLAHVPILWFAFQRLAGLPGYVQFAVFAGLIVAVPAILYHSIEEPLIRIGSRLSERVAQRAQTREVRGRGVNVAAVGPCVQAGTD
jgi:peptidoglycan/LPS O-acetylase OafA/YrhL